MVALTYTPIFAHFGHWYVSLPTFMGPVLIIAIAVKVSAWRDRRRVGRGEASHTRVAAIQEDDKVVVRVKGALDYPALLDIEQELGVAVARAPQVLLDLREVSSLEPESAWNVAEIIAGVDRSAEVVVVVIGAGPAGQTLRKVCELEGIEFVEEAPAGVGAPGKPPGGPSP